MDTLLLSIRGNTIRYSSFRKKQKVENEKQLEKQIQMLENKLYKNIQNTPQSILQELNDKKNELQQVRKEKH